MTSEEKKSDRRSFLRTVGAGIAGVVVGTVAGYLASTGTRAAGGEQVRTVTQTTTLREVITQTVTAGAPPKQIPSTPLKIGLINPLSGGAATAGDPGAKGGLLAAEMINEAGGILGRKIQIVGPLDTRGSPDVAVDVVTRLVQQEGVQYIVGEIASSAGLALVDAADRLGFIWLPCEVWTPRLFENPRKFSFRLTWNDAAAGVGAALMALRLKPDLKKIAGVNQDYAHGRDQWESFKLTIKALRPDVEVVEELWFPFLQLTDATPLITKLMSSRPDVVHSTMWGSDKFVFYKQAIPAGYFKTVLHLDTCLLGLEAFSKDTWPDGLWAGAAYIRYYPSWNLWSLNKEFNERFIQRFGVKAFGEGAQSAANIFTSFLAIKQGIERAAAAVGGWPEIDEVAKAMVGMRVVSPKGVLTIREDHEGEGPQVWGRTHFVPNVEYPVVDPKEVITFPSEVTLPPVGVNWKEWLSKYSY